MRRDNLSAVTRAERAGVWINMVSYGLLLPLVFATFIAGFWLPPRVCFALFVATIVIGTLTVLMAVFELVMLRKLRRSLGPYPYSARYRNRTPYPYPRLNRDRDKTRDRNR